MHLTDHLCFSTVHLNTILQISAENVLLTALIPHTTMVFPILAMAEPSAVFIEPTLIATGRNVCKLRPSGLTFCALNTKEMYR